VVLESESLSACNIEQKEVNIVVIVYKCHLSEKVGAVCVQTLQVQLHTAVPART
jgi:hypothetical protein